MFKHTLARAAMGALAALALGLLVVVLAQGFSTDAPVRVVENVGLGVVCVAVAGTVCALVVVRLAGWRDPASEREFEQIVRRAERLAAVGQGSTRSGDAARLDPHDDEDFAELIGGALDELPDLLYNALRNVAVVISDSGWEHHAYGLYQGPGAQGGDAHGRIVIFRDTLRRDFGYDPELLRDQVVRTVRHELAHHVGFDELGVSLLDL